MSADSSTRPGDGSLRARRYRTPRRPRAAAAAHRPRGPRPWESLAPRQVPPEDWHRFEGSVGEILTAFGLDLDTVGTRDTPRRFFAALFDTTAGYEGDPNLLTASLPSATAGSTAD